MKNYSWCLCCEKAIKGEAKEKVQKCPYCGAGYFDIQNWDDCIAVRGNPDYPDEPIPGKEYPVY